MNAVKTMIPVGNALYLFAYGPDQHSGLYLWKTNGTAQGTTLVKELPSSDNIDYYINDGILYFNLNDGSRLWRSDGTPCGTYSFETGVPTFDLTGVASTLIFNGFEVGIGVEPFTYKTSSIPDGDCAGAMAVAAANEDKTIGYPNPFTDEFVLNVPGDKSEFLSVIITTITGFPVEKIETVPANTDQHLGQHWAPGLYIMKVTNGEKTTSTIMVKK
jgi:ELWxxDGT repeat protein